MQIRCRWSLSSLVVVVAFGALRPAHAADHDDTPELKAMGRPDARLTDLHVFTRGTNLVVTLCSNPAIPVTASSYAFPSDLEFHVHIDHHSQVTFSDPSDLALYGGTITDPNRIAADLSFDIRFDGHGSAKVRQKGRDKVPHAELQLFAGLRDDPFIRGPRTGRNVAGIVLEFPLRYALGSDTTMLVWATSEVPDIEMHQADHAGRALRSQFSENLALNLFAPDKQPRMLGLKPDVVIFNTSLLAAFPNGRDLTDDVVDLVGDVRVLANDAPFPTQNDVPFLTTFPYLAPPH